MIAIIIVSTGSTLRLHIDFGGMGFLSVPHLFLPCSSPLPSPILSTCQTLTEFRQIVKNWNGLLGWPVKGY